jgi:hypothetical protein
VEALAQAIEPDISNNILRLTPDFSDLDIIDQPRVAKPCSSQATAGNILNVIHIEALPRQRIPGLFR